MQTLLAFSSPGGVSIARAADIAAERLKVLRARLADGTPWADMAIAALAELGVLWRALDDAGRHLEAEGVRAAAGRIRLFLARDEDFVRWIGAIRDIAKGAMS